MKTAAIYTRVSSDQQRENKTIGSQVDELLQFAQQQGYVVPEQYIFRDEGYSGALLVRPGLEKVRDLSAEGQIQAVLICSPDRLSRNYAYQVVLIDEFASCNTEVLFVNSPKAETPEEALLLQFQGMISEYERAIIKERSRRGKRFKAKSGVVSVLCGAPYGYTYIKKTQETAAYYQINDAEAAVVREMFRLYTEEFCGIGSIARKLTAEQIPTRKNTGRWERSVIWSMLRNPAYTGKACYGKTERAERQRITKPLRTKGGYVAKNGCNREKPREEWIEIPVPALVSPQTFELAQERLKDNKLHAQRNTKVETLLQGMMVCSGCGYSLYRTYTETSAGRRIYYYRCFGSDRYRFEGVRKCNCKPVRQDYLDGVVWQKIQELLEDPALIQREVEKRAEQTRSASPVLKQKVAIEKQHTKLSQSMDKLLDAYQEGLVSIAQLRERMPELQRRLNATQKELENLKHCELALDGRLQYLDVQSFTSQLGVNVGSLDIKEKKKILRLLVKEVVVGDDCIEIRHSIPLKEGTDEQKEKKYQLCTRSDKPVVSQSVFASCF
jgi:site-specific DNA recombinase